MINSRNIDDLRADVAQNCRLFIQLCEKEGLKVLVTATVRDREYQEYCYKIGTSMTKVPSFHAIGIGLAFDFCKNVAGHEYDDQAFFERCGAIGKKVGFEWGGDWKSFVDKTHFQWGAYGKYTSDDILAGRLPPAMPLYKEVETLTREEALKVMVDKGVITSPDYWRKVCDVVNYLDALIVNIATKLK